MTNRILTSALFAGFGAGLLAAVLQYIFIQPVLLHAELFESGALSHDPAIGSAVHVDRPPFDMMRNALSVLFAALIYTGYALILVALMATASERGHALTVKRGIIWGISGFVAVHFAPAFGLAPELPGFAAADVTLRQIWWFATVATTGIGLWLLAFGTSPIAVAGAAVLIAAPHIVGAPHPEMLTGNTPPELAGLFASRTLGVGLAAWATLGALAAYFWNSEH